MPSLKHAAVAVLSLALLSAPTLAANKVKVCHNGKAININENALQAHLNHGDSEGPCPVPSFTSVVVLRCLNTEGGQILVSGVSGSDNADADLPLPQRSCANAVANMLNSDFRLKQVSTGLLRGETEYLFLGKSKNQ